MLRVIRYNEVVCSVNSQEAAMLKLLSAVALTLAWAVALSALIGPGLSSLEYGLESGKRIALAEYAAAHPTEP